MQHCPAFGVSDCAHPSLPPSPLAPSLPPPSAGFQGVEESTGESRLLRGLNAIEAALCDPAAAAFPLALADTGAEDATQATDTAWAVSRSLSRSLSYPTPKNPIQLLSKGVQAFLVDSFSSKGNSLTSSRAGSPDAASRFRKAAARVKVLGSASRLLQKQASNTRLATLGVLPRELEGDAREKVQAALAMIGSWSDFDIFALDELTGGEALLFVVWEQLRRFALFKALQLDADVTLRCLEWVQSQYLADNPYHNALHVADVVQALGVLLAQLGDCLSPLETFALILAAAVHDLGHDGYTNQYHVERTTERAVAHNDRAVQENYHLATFFARLCTAPEMDILATLTDSERKEVRKMVIDAVLATEMAHHYDMVAAFKASSLSRGSELEQWRDSVELRGYILHAADISNQCRPYRFARKWSRRVLDEFFLQGDSERDEGAAVSPLCDRHTTKLGGSQVGFVKFVVQPTWEVLESVLPSLSEDVLPCLYATLKEWEALSAKEKAAEVEAEAAGIPVSLAA